MIYFIHGEDQALTRSEALNLLKAAKKEKKEILRLDGLKISLNELIQAFESNSLFGQDKLIYLENFFQRNKSKNKEEILTYLKASEILPDLIIWEKKEISGTTLRWLPKNWDYRVFKIKQSIFSFLDSLTPYNQETNLSLLRKASSKDGPELVFYMMAKRIRDLLLAKELGKKGLVGAPWQIGKLIKQSQAFTIEKLLTIYKKLLNIDLDIKTGGSFMPLDWHLDLLLTRL
ncbi:hypothetical protein COT75_00260 [Candidatus Beckwithbacteria bacterium CG10_big_fil_rev_8_21_14_0_10_34_10]|uniref:DNA polymerase III subunit delta n=1 Tax=Candidatus Beckwithbacteria bacterium CG10_big_fil_rev_8_21_14_0_10_34_10 TaxID=1974495 RepID=A0A2H0WAE3_9BACT|nr:MAG: hypothetical protein COT75_00260 [Candidatus Beckwithbacteria bacterium CG10_big_fil_rev_8_21_14_0_10_34_10]